MEKMTWPSCQVVSYSFMKDHLSAAFLIVKFHFEGHCATAGFGSSSSFEEKMHRLLN